MGLKGSGIGDRGESETHGFPYAGFLFVRELVKILARGDGVLYWAA